MQQTRYWVWFKEHVKAVKGDDEFGALSVCEILHSASKFVLDLERRMDETDVLSERKELYDIVSCFYRDINNVLQKQVQKYNVSLSILADCDIRFEALDKMFNEWTELKNSLADETIEETFYRVTYVDGYDYPEPIEEEISLYNMDNLFETEGHQDTLAIDILIERALVQLLLRIKGNDPYAGPSEKVKKLTEYLDFRGNLSKTIEIQNKLVQELKSKVIGQDLAIEKFVRGYSRALSAGVDKNKPEAVYLFAGPPGVGKTYLAEQFADILQTEGYKYKRFDMSAYSGTSDNVSGLVGFEKSWKNAQQGSLTGFVDENPRAILLIDEIEKASESVRLLFLSILEGAELMDKYLEKQVSFSQTILIFTTNEGKDIYLNNRYSNLTALPDSSVVAGLESSGFAPELLSRFASSNIIVFNYLEADALANLVKISIENACERIKTRNKNLEKMTYDADLMARLFILSKGGSVDARNISSKTKSFVTDLFLDSSSYISDRKRNVNGFKSINVSIDESSISEEAKDYLIMPPNRKVLYFGKETKTAFKYVADQADIEIVKKFDDFEQKCMDNNPNSDTSYAAYIIDMFDSKESIITAEEGYKCLECLYEKKNEVPVFVVDRGFSNEDKRALLVKNVIAFLDVQKMPNMRKAQICFLEDLKNVYFISSFNKLAKAEKCFSSIRNMDYNSRDGEMNIIFSNISIQNANIESARERALNNRYLLSEKKEVYLSDIFGNEEAVSVARRCIDNIKYPERYLSAGVRLLRGILMHGEPGMGKTMLAKAIAYESGASFISSVGSDFVESNGIQELENIFETARRKKPCVIFIDEFDAIAKSRKYFSSGIAELVLEKFLQEMDGVGKDNTGVYVIGATNYSLNLIDDAIIRRFSEKIEFKRPSGPERCEFLGRLFEKKGLNILTEYSNVLVRHMFGFQDNFSEIETFLDESIAEIVYKKKDKFDKSDVTLDYLLDRLQRINYGEKREETVEMLRTCFHEAGHSVLQWINGRRLSYITVVPRDRFNGFAMADPKLYSGNDYLRHIRIALAGRAAEIIYAKKYSKDKDDYQFELDNAINVGASSDLKKATSLAYHYICSCGLKGMLSVVPDNFIGEEYGVIKEDILPESRKEKIWDEVEKVLQEQMNVTLKILEDKWEKVEALAFSVRYLREIDGDQIYNIINSEVPYIDRTCFVDFDQDYILYGDEDKKGNYPKLVYGYPIWPTAYIAKDRKMSYDPEKEYYYALRFADTVKIYVENKDNPNILPDVMKEAYQNNASIVRFATKEAAMDYINSRAYMIRKKDGRVEFDYADNYLDLNRFECIDAEKKLYRFPFEIIDMYTLEGMCHCYEKEKKIKLSELGKVEFIMSLINDSIFKGNDDAAVVLQLHGQEQLDAFNQIVEKRRSELFYYPGIDVLE